MEQEGLVCSWIADEARTIAVVALHASQRHSPELGHTPIDLAAWAAPAFRSLTLK